MLFWFQANLHLRGVVCRFRKRKVQKMRSHMELWQCLFIRSKRNHQEYQCGHVWGDFIDQYGKFISSALSSFTHWNLYDLHLCSNFLQQQILFQFSVLCAISNRGNSHPIFSSYAWAEGTTTITPKFNNAVRKWFRFIRSCSSLFIWVTFDK